MTTDSHQPDVLVVIDTREILDQLAGLLAQERHQVTTSLALLNIDKVKDLAPDMAVQDILFEQTQEEGWKFLTLSRLDPDLSRIPLRVHRDRARSRHGGRTAAGLRAVLRATGDR